MNLRKKTALLILVFIAVVVVPFYYVSSTIFQRGFNSLEVAEIRENVRHAQQTVADLLDEMDRTAVDWASWDDTYAFMEDLNHDYIDSNLSGDTLPAIRMNMIAFVRPSGELLYGQGFDLASKKSRPIPGDFGDRLSALPPLLRVGSASNGVKGILQLAEGPMLLAARPILTTENTGPSRGTLVFGRFLTNPEIQKISRFVEGSLEIRRFDDPSGAHVHGPELLADEKAVVVRVLNERQIEGCAVLRDIAGQPALVVRVEMRRSIHARALETLRLDVMFLLTMGLVIGLLLYLLVSKVLLSRVFRTTEQIGVIGVKGFADARLTVEGHDEFSELTIEINRMLDALRQSDEALRVSEQRLRNALDATNEGLWEWNVKTGVGYFSPRYCTMLGYEPGELPEDFTTWTDLLHPDDRASILSMIQEQLRQKVVDYRAEFRMKHKTGRWCWIRSHGKVIEWDPDGNAVRMVGTHIDITEKKQAGDEVRRLNEQLEQRVQKRTAQLEAANRQLESFNYSVSHDLRAPLRAIDGFTQMVIEECQGTLPEEAGQNLARIRAAAQRMARLIDSMLMLSRLSRREPCHVPVDLSGLARTILRDTQKKDPGRDVSIVIADDMMALGDPDLLRIVLENLFQNAWKFTSKRKGAMIEFGMQDAERKPDGVESDLRMPKSQTGRKVFFVRDNGSGFDMAYADKLFGVFQRLHSTAEFEGTGIGLATVQKIIHLHGGEIWADGAVGKGATFYFTI